MTIPASFKFRKCFHLSIAFPVSVILKQIFKGPKRKGLSNVQDLRSSLDEVEQGV
jgi:hypothetical protein